MSFFTVDSPAAWTASGLEGDPRWIFELGESARSAMSSAVRAAWDPGRSLFDYSREDFNLDAGWPVIAAAFEEARMGRGVALVRGLPREGLSEDQFRLLTWAIGLHAGVGRPQGKASQYISEVRDAGTNYRTATGRGYSSNAELDFHTDSADMVALSCFNQAVSGGMSMVTSSVAAYGRMVEEYPALAEALHEPVHFSRQGEHAPDEAPSYPHPIFDQAGGLLFSKWNRNRVTSAQKLDGVPRLSARQREALETFDALLRRPDLMYTMYLQPGDVQLLNSHVTLHARTDFVDHEDAVRKRLLFRLWLAMPDGVRLPESWRVQYRAVEPNTVRGGIYGHHYDDRCRAFDAKQAGDRRMKLAA